MFLYKLIDYICIRKFTKLYFREFVKIKIGFKKFNDFIVDDVVLLILG